MFSPLRDTEVPMTPQTLVRRVERLDERVTELEKMPARLDALTVEVSQLRTEMRTDFSAVRGEMREMKEELRGEMQEMREELRAEMRVLHEDVISRLALLQEGLLGPRKRK